MIKGPGKSGLFVLALALLFLVGLTLLDVAGAHFRLGFLASAG